MNTIKYTMDFFEINMYNMVNMKWGYEYER